MSEQVRNLSSGDPQKFPVRLVSWLEGSLEALEDEQSDEPEADEDHEEEGKR
jgi:hypothetical protein